MEVTLRSVQVAAGARVVAEQVGVIAGFGCGGVQSGSVAALHEIPCHQDGGIVTLREGCDSREGAGRWGKTRVSLTLHGGVCSNEKLMLLIRLTHPSAGRWWRWADSHTRCF